MILLLIKSYIPFPNKKKSAVSIPLLQPHARKKKNF